MKPKAFREALHDANAGHLVALLNAAHVPSTGGHKHVLLGQATGSAQSLKRGAEAGMTRDVVSTHSLDFRAVRPKRPRLNSPIDGCSQKKSPSPQVTLGIYKS